MCTDAPSDGGTKDGALSVLYTGTRRPRIEHPRLRIIYRAMLQSTPLHFNHARAHQLAKCAKTLVFYSPNSVECLANSGVVDGLELHKKTTWAVGEKTAESLFENFGIRARVPDDPQFSGMLAHFHARKPALPLLAFGIQDSPRSLIGSASGQFSAPEAADIHEFPIYQTAAQHHRDLTELIEREAIRWVALTSPRGVDAFVSHLSAPTLAKLRLAAIGPTTADAIRAHGLPIDLQVQLPDRDQMMLEILRAAHANSTPKN